MGGGTRQSVTPQGDAAKDEPASGDRCRDADRPADARRAADVRPAAGRRPLPVRRGQEPAGGRDGQALALADHAGQGPRLSPSWTTPSSAAISIVGVNETDFQHWARSKRDTTLFLFDQEFAGPGHGDEEAPGPGIVHGQRHRRRRTQALLSGGRRSGHATGEPGRRPAGRVAVAGAIAHGARESLQAQLLVKYVAGETGDDAACQQALAAARLHHAFHWPFEFPEVFLAENRSGFDAFVSNPPFIGGQFIRGTLGGDYLAYLKDRWNHTRGSADFCTFFFLAQLRAIAASRRLGLDRHQYHCPGRHS